MTDPSLERLNSLHDSGAISDAEHALLVANQSPGSLAGYPPPPGSLAGYPPPPGYQPGYPPPPGYQPGYRPPPGSQAGYPPPPGDPRPPGGNPPPPGYPAGQLAYGPPPGKTSHLVRNVILGVVALIVVISIAIGAATSKKKTTNPGGSTAPSPGVSHGLGASDASGDVTIGGLTYDASTTIGEVSVSVTNHSSKRSDYIITVAVESGNGGTQLGTASVLVQNLEPGQTTSQQGLLSLTGAPPADYKLVLQSVDRLASS